MNLLEIVNEKAENWDLLKMEESEAISSLRIRVLNNLVAHCLNNQDYLIGLTVLDKAESLVRKALNTEDGWVRDLIENFSQGMDPSVQLETIIRGAESMISQVQIITDSYADVAAKAGADVVANTSVDTLFVSPYTSSMAERQEMAMFLSKTGFGQFLENSKVRFTDDHIKIAYLLFMILQGTRPQESSQGVMLA